MKIFALLVKISIEDAENNGLKRGSIIYWAKQDVPNNGHDSDKSSWTYREELQGN